MTLSRTFLLGLALTGLLLMGCGKKEEPAPEAPKVEAPKAEAPKPEAPAEAPKAEAPKVEEPKVEAPKPEDRKEKLAAAYADVYCAQLTGKPETVLEAYKRHGFENLEDWTRTWRAAAKDVEWVKQVMTDARASCPH